MGELADILRAEYMSVGVVLTLTDVEIENYVDNLGAFAHQYSDMPTVDKFLNMYMQMLPHVE